MRPPGSRYSPIKFVAADGGCFPSLPPTLLDIVNLISIKLGLAPLRTQFHQVEVLTPSLSFFPRICIIRRPRSIQRT